MKHVFHVMRGRLLHWYVYGMVLLMAKTIFDALSATRKGMTSNMSKVKREVLLRLMYALNAMLRLQRGIFQENMELVSGLGRHAREG
jgi:hypothetical protein